jgi:hypothetical protein
LIRLETKQDFERARERLRRHNSEALLELLMSLAGSPGPIGEQIRTFIEGDVVTDVVHSLQQRIRGLAAASEYTHRHSFGQEIGMKLDLIVDSVDRLLMVRAPQAAFDILVALFEADAVAMESCGEHDWQVASAYKRAAAVMAEAAKSLPQAEVHNRIRALLQADGYGVRSVLASVL